MQDCVVAMMQLELLTRVETIVQDWVDMVHLKLMSWVEARVVTREQACVAAMMNTEQLTRAVERMVTMIHAR